MQKASIYLLLAALTGALFAEAALCADTTPTTKPANTDSAANSVPLTARFTQGSRDEPTYINSNSLLLRTKERKFEYKGQVSVKNGDMTLTADLLEGFYSERNEIERLIASSNVLITKGENIKATCQRAAYEAKSDTLTLTENPQLEQDGSILSADLIRIFLQDERSEAEGAVRVTLVKKPADKPASLLATPAPSAVPPASG